jgi:hypothetical protein
MLSAPPFTRLPGSHVIYALQQTRRYKVISIDNHHNSHPAALSRVAQLARESLPKDATELEKETAEIDDYICDLAKVSEVRGVFEQYGVGGIWGVIHIAVGIFGRNLQIDSDKSSLTGLQSGRGIYGSPIDLLRQQCFCHGLAFTDHVRVRLHSAGLLIFSYSVWNAT